MKLSISLLTLTSTIFYTSTVSADNTQVDTPKLLRGATMLASDNPYLDSTDYAAAPIANYDYAYIHKGCSMANDAYPKYCNDDNCKGWHGWYCNDGQKVDPSDPSEFDDAWIHKGCDKGVQFDSMNWRWYCKDSYDYDIDLAYIKRNCNQNVVYHTNAYCKKQWGSECAFIEDLSDDEGAWYCGSENVWNNDPSEFDNAFIKQKCNSGVHYDDKLLAWYCN